MYSHMYLSFLLINSSMNNKHLSWNKEINNNFIIASRAYFLQYFQQSPTCTRVNNLVHIAMWLTLTCHIAMWPTSKEFTSVIKLVHIIMWFRLNEFWGLIMFCLREVLVNGSAIFRSVCTSQISMSYCECCFHAPLGAIPNGCSTIRIRFATQSHSDRC